MPSIRHPSGLRVAPAILASLLCSTAAAQCPELVRLDGNGAGAAEWAGEAVALDTDLAVVGARLFDGSAGNDTGAAYVFRFDGAQWSEETRLEASDATALDEFGRAVAVDKNLIAVGVPDSDSAGVDAGAVYVFRWNGTTWIEEAKLIASDAGAGDRFGTCVSVDGPWIAVGAPDDDSVNTDSGSVYTFQYMNGIGWQETQRLNAPTPTAFDHFGSAVSLRGIILAVGVPRLNPQGRINAGGVMVYTRPAGTWVHDQTLEGVNNSDEFGSSVATDGALLVAGAPLADPLASASGSATVFRHDGTAFVEEDVLLPPTAAISDNFGASVAVDSGTGAVLVGSPFHDGNGTDAGLAYTYVFARSAWYLDQELAPATPAASDWYGASVALRGHRALVGAPRRESSPRNDTGAAFVHSVHELLLTAAPSPALAGDTLTFTGACGDPGTPCFFYSASVNGLPLFQSLFILPFAADHRAVLSAVVPPGLAGLDVGFIALRRTAWNQVALSNLAIVQFR